jgi:Zn-dependent protease
MTSAFRIARIFGVDVRVHLTFVLLVVLLVAWETTPGEEGGRLVAPILVILSLFLLAGLHELAHAVVAKRLGVEVQDILVLPILLMVRLRLPERPRTELAVAAAGPAANLLLAVLMLALMPLLDLPFGALTRWPPNSLFGLLFWVNLLMGTLNLLPAFPMDGGRILRAVLATRMDHVLATRLAVRIGWLVVLLAGAVAMLKEPAVFVALLAVFLLILGQREEAAVTARARARERRLERFRLGLASLGLGPALPFGDLRRIGDPSLGVDFERFRRRAREGPAGDVTG